MNAFCHYVREMKWMSNHPMFFCCQESFTPSDFKTLKVSFLTSKASQNSRNWKKQFTWTRLPINKDRKKPKGPWQNPWFETGKSIISTNYTISPTWIFLFHYTASSIRAWNKEVTDHPRWNTNLCDSIDQIRWFPFLHATFWILLGGPSLMCDVATIWSASCAHHRKYTTLGSNISFCQCTFEPGSSEWPFWWI